MPAFNGEFKLANSDNYGEFLKEIGTSLTTRKLAESNRPTVRIAHSDGGEWTIKTIAFKNSEIRFKLGEEFEEQRLDGATVKAVANLDGDRLVQKQFGEQEVTITYTIDGDSLTITYASGSVVATRHFQRV